MSALRDSLPASQRAALDQALADAGPILRQAQDEIAERARIEGPAAAAAASHAVKGGLKTADEVEAQYLRLLDEERAKAKAA